MLLFFIFLPLFSMEIPGRVWSTPPGISMLSGFFIDGSRASFHKQKPQYNIIYAMPGSGRGMPFLGRQGKVTDLPNGRLYSQKLDAVCSQFVKTYEILKTEKKTFDNERWTVHNIGIVFLEKGRNGPPGRSRDGRNLPHLERSPAGGKPVDRCFPETGRQLSYFRGRNFE